MLKKIIIISVVFLAALTGIAIAVADPPIDRNKVTMRLADICAGYAIDTYNARMFGYSPLEISREIRSDIRQVKHLPPDALLALDAMAFHLPYATAGTDDKDAHREMSSKICSQVIKNNGY